MKLRYIFHHPPPETNVTLQKTAAKITLFSCCGESLLVLRIFSLFKVSFHFQNNVHDTGQAWHLWAGREITV
jgi:hypothetical protein